MKFQVNRDGTPVSCDFVVGETKNLVSIRNEIIKFLWNNAHIIPSTLKFKCNNEYLDINKSLLQIVGSEECTILCEIDCQINPQNYILLNLMLENEIITSIEVPRNSDFNQIKNIISDVCDIDVSHIYEDGVELNNGSFGERDTANTYLLKVSEKLREIKVLHILERGLYVNIFFSNKERVFDLKCKIAEKINYAPDDFVLFQNFEFLEDECLIKKYKIQSGFTVNYCCFQKVGDFEKLDNITDGSYSTIFMAKVVANDELITMKKYDIVGDDTFPRTFKPMIRELISYALLDDQSRIVRFKAFFKDAESFYVGMEYMTGGSMHTYVTKNKPLPERLIRKWAKQILEGLKSLHQRNIVHSDLKTSNILLDDNNDAKISGFSSSKYFQGVLSNQLNEGFLISKPGTHNYMAPEVFEENGKVGVKSDIWSFGAILVELVTGKEPFSHMEKTDVALEINRSKTIVYDPPRGMSDNLKDLIGKCLQANPNHRLSANDLLMHAFLI